MELVTVFGGTGFLGRRIVEHLAKQGMTIRVATRHSGETGRSAAADVRDQAAVAAAVSGADCVVNAVSAYTEKRGVTYNAVHVEGARNVAAASRHHGVRRLVYISGIGADPASRSSYIRARGQGELAVREAFRDAIILRPSVMFASDGSFLAALAAIARSTPVVPMIGGGRTKMQPIHASDVAAAVRLSLRDPAARGRTYELGGPESFTLRQIMEMILARIGRRRLLVPVPFVLAYPLAKSLELLPDAPLTVAQVDLLKRDNIPDPGVPGIAEFAITPHRMQDAIADLTCFD